MPELVLPESRYKKSFLEALAEFHAEQRNLEWKVQDLERDFSTIVEHFQKTAQGIELPERHVPSTQFWLVQDETYLGRVNIRHWLSKDLLIEGGHIGYEVRPSERRKGYGHMLLREALKIARQDFKIELALVTCDTDNEASKRIIKAAGGILIYPVSPVLRFWVPTGI